MSSPAIPRIGIPAIHLLLDALPGHAIDPVGLLAEAGIRDVRLADPDARFPLAALDALWDRAAARVGDPDLGLHLAGAVEPGSFGLLSFLGTASPSLGEALHRVMRYFRLLSDGSRYQLHVCDGVATITASQDTEPGPPVRQRVEFTLTVLHCYIQRAIADWQVLDVFFEHAAPARLDEHCRIYGRVPRFEGGHSGFSFDSALLRRPLATGNPTLANLLEQLAAHLLADHPATMTVAATLRELIIRDGFAQEHTLASAARQLHLSARTLQRRLREEGTTHHKIVDGARKALASRMIAQPGVGIAEVAFALGFSESRALHRAFKRWTGVTPTAYRRTTCDAAWSNQHAGRRVVSR